MKLFDAHNHIHLGPLGLTPLLEKIPLDASSETATFSGAAIMSTHPRDYPHVDSLVSDLRKRNFKAVPCYGIHPWFLNDVISDPESARVLDNGEEVWFRDLKQQLQQHPDAIVGEIGLDGARWVEAGDDGGDQNDSTLNQKSIWERRRELACPMPLQKEAFIKQLILAAELKRPVSIHVVRAWGELFDSLNEVRERMKEKHQEMQNAELSDRHVGSMQQKNQVKRSRRKDVLLPPKMYFHAFSGKSGVIPSLLSICARGNIDPNSDVYFGFAPAIPNFYAPKTANIMKQIGLQRLLLETDLEDASRVWDDLIHCVEGIANALEIDVTEVADQTYTNAECFYFDSF